MNTEPNGRICRGACVVSRSRWTLTCTSWMSVRDPKTDRRIAQARQLFDDDVVAGHRYGAASKRPNFRQHLERRSESGDLREDLLGSADHLSVLDVVSGLVPWA